MSRISIFWVMLTFSQGWLIVAVLWDNAFALCMSLAWLGFSIVLGTLRK